MLYELKTHVSHVWAIVRDLSLARDQASHEHLKCWLMLCFTWLMTSFLVVRKQKCSQPVF